MLLNIISWWLKFDFWACSMLRRSVLTGIMSGTAVPNMQGLAANEDYVLQINVPCCVLDSPWHRITTFRRAVSNSIPLTRTVLREEPFLTHVNFSVVFRVIFFTFPSITAAIRTLWYPPPAATPYIVREKLDWFLPVLSIHRFWINTPNVGIRRHVLFYNRELAILHYGVLYPWSIWRYL